MAITGACHVESAVGSGAASVVATCQRMGESCGIHRRKWSRIVAVIVACQGVVELRGIRRREWSSAVTVTAACLGVQIRRLKFDSGQSLMMEFGSRRSPGGVLLAVGVVGGARLPWESRRSPLGVEVAGGAPSNQSQVRSPTPMGVRTDLTCG